jgi:hypothetical protein
MSGTRRTLRRWSRGFYAPSYPSSHASQRTPDLASQVAHHDPARPLAPPLPHHRRGSPRPRGTPDRRSCGLRREHSLFVGAPVQHLGLRHVRAPAQPQGAGANPDQRPGPRVGQSRPQSPRRFGATLHRVVYRQVGCVLQRAGVTAGDHRRVGAPGVAARGHHPATAQDVETVARPRVRRKKRASSASPSVGPEAER